MSMGFGHHFGCLSSLALKGEVSRVREVCPDEGFCYSSLFRQGGGVQSSWATCSMTGQAWETIHNHCRPDLLPDAGSASDATT